MSKKSDYKEWGHRLDAGRTDDDLLRLAAELEQSPQPVDAMPTNAKNALRQQLVGQHPQTKRPLFGRLRAAASTAVAFTVLAAVVVFAWLSFGSRPSTSTAVSVPRATPTAEATPTPLPTHPPTAMPPASTIDTAVDVGNIIKATFGRVVALNYFSLSPPPYLPGTTLNGVLDWTILDKTEQQTAFLHLLDSSEQLIAQLDLVLPDSNGAEPFQLPLPDSLPAGEYTLVAGVYDSLTQVRLTTSSGETAVALTTIMIEALPDDQKDSVTLSQISPNPGTFITESTTFTVSVNYALESQETAVLRAKLLVVEDNMNRMRGVASGSVEIRAEENTAVVTFPFNGRDVVAPANLLLLVEMMPNVEPVGPSLAGDLSTGQWRYDPAAANEDAIALLSATQQARTSALVNLDLTLAISMSKAAAYDLDLMLAHPNWENNGQIMTDFSIVPTGGGAYRLTAPIEEIRAATGTDSPVIVATLTLTYLNPDRFDTLRQTLSNCPLDLTRSDAFTCLPQDGE